MNKSDNPIKQALPDIEIVDAEIEFEKRPIDDILEDADAIDAKKIAEEVVEWAAANVDNYIDNHVKMFKLDLVLDNTDSMQETKKLQDLYRAIPEDVLSAEKLEEITELAEEVGWDEAMSKISEMVDDDCNIQEIIECRNKLNDITTKAHEAMMVDEVGLANLFEKLSFYYELQSLRDGIPVIQKLEGKAKILRFEYEAFSMGMKICRGEDAMDLDGEFKEDVPSEKKVIKQYTIPEGFSVWIEIAFRPKVPPKSLF
jgi:hypothetical protein